MARSPAPPERVLAYADAAHPPTLRDIVYAYYSRVQLYILLLLLVASSSISCKNTAYASTIYRASTHPHPAGPRQGEEEEATVSPQSESEKRPPPPPPAETSRHLERGTGGRRRIEITSF